MESPRKGRHLGLTPKDSCSVDLGWGSESIWILNQELETTLDIQCSEYPSPQVNLKAWQIIPVTALPNRMESLAQKGPWEERRAKGSDTW